MLELLSIETYISDESNHLGLSVSSRKSQAIIFPIRSDIDQIMVYPIQSELSTDIIYRYFYLLVTSVSHPFY